MGRGRNDAKTQDAQSLMTNRCSFWCFAKIHTRDTQVWRTGHRRDRKRSKSSSSLPPPAARGLPPEVESAEGAPNLPFGETPRVHTDAAEDVLEGRKE